MYITFAAEYKIRNEHEIEDRIINVKCPVQRGFDLLGL